MLITKPSTNVCSRKEQSHLISKSKEYHVDQCLKYENEENNKLTGVPSQWMTRTVNLICGQ